MKTIKFLLILMFPVLILSCRNQNQGNIPSKDTTDAMLVENARVEGEKGEGEPQSVEDFVREAASGGMMEVELGRYAEQNAQNPRVRNFGAMMARDHQKANEELKSIASSKNITVPAQMEDNHRNTVEELKQKTGSEFDSSYMDEMVDDHESDVDKFRRQAENGKDPEVKAFAARTLEVLLIHQDSAKNIRDAINR